MINQSYKNLEIICLNDGSTDKTAEVLEQYAKSDSRIKVVHNESNLGLIRTLNKGIILAQGEYIARMDADDIADLGRIEFELNYMKSNPKIDIISTGSYIISEEGEIISKKIPRTLTSTGCFYSSFFYVPVGHPELLIKTKVLKENHFLFESYVIHTEDYELWARLLRKGYKLCNIEDLLHYFRVNSQSVSQKYTQIQDANFVSCAQLHYEEFTQKKYRKELISVLVNRMNKDLLYKDFVSGLVEMKRFKLFFIMKESINDATILMEIQTVYFTHLIDICYQAIKKSSWKIKFYAVFKLIANGNMFINRKVILYVKNKIR
jgi:glycosyltransferase involved in cell wall biosynthesis